MRQKNICIIDKVARFFFFYVAVAMLDTNRLKFVACLGKYLLDAKVSNTGPFLYYVRT